MYSAIMLALFIADNWQENMRPSGAEVQAAMSARWVMISSIGDDNRDYAVRNLSCGKSEPIKQPETKNTDKPAEQNRGIAEKILFDRRDYSQFVVRCTFEAASVHRNSHKPRKLQIGGKGIPRAFSKRALDRIPPSAWQEDMHEFIYVTRGRCRFMGRTPREGECHNWVINLGASLAEPNAEPVIKPRVHLDCRYLSRTPEPGECLGSPIENNASAAPSS